MQALLCPVTPTRKLASRPLGLIGSFFVVTGRECRTEERSDEGGGVAWFRDSYEWNELEYLKTGDRVLSPRPEKVRISP